LHQKLHVRPGRKAADSLVTDKQPQGPAVFSSELQAAKVVRIEFVLGGPDGSDPFASQSLIQGPEPILFCFGTDDDQVFQADSQHGGRGWIKIAAVVQHHHGPAFMRDFPSGDHGQCARSAAASIGEPLDKRSPPPAAIGKKPVQRGTSRG
jgi:hypothetical protein